MSLPEIQKLYWNPEYSGEKLQDPVFIVAIYVHRVNIKFELVPGNFRKSHRKS